MTTTLLRAFTLMACLLLLPARLAAVEVDGLFEAAVPVPGQGAADRARAIVEGFRQVLVKASGQRSVLASPGVQQELAKAESWLLSYRYDTPRPEGAAAVAPADAAASRLQLNFDPASVLGILNRSGAPVWSANRPRVYLWVMREGAAPTLIAQGVPSMEAMLDAAQQRALPVTVPSPPDLAEVGAPGGVQALAARAGASAVLAASVGTAAGRARATAVLVVDGVEARLEATGVDEVAALRELVEMAADQLGNRYGVVARRDQFHTVRLRVEGLATLDDWAALERWLLSQPLVRDAVVSQVDVGGTDYILVLAGEPERLPLAMRGDGRFAGVGELAPDGQAVRLQAVFASSAGR